MYGDEHLRFNAMTDTRAMAKRMTLIGVQPTEEIIKGFHQLPADKIKEISQAAWGIYGALS
jgi:hypothetical protein